MQKYQRTVQQRQQYLLVLFNAHHKVPNKSEINIVQVHFGELDSASTNHIVPRVTICHVSKSDW